MPIRSFLACALIAVMLWGCTPQTTANPTELPATVAPTAAPTPEPTAAPTAAPTPEPTAAPTATPVETPLPTAVPLRSLQALYPCERGLCLLELGQETPMLVVAADPLALHGYAFSANGRTIVYGINNTSDESQVAIVQAQADGSQPRELFTVAGAESGAGGYEGASVLGLSADGREIIFEDMAQLFRGTLDGTQREPVLEQRPYGASSTHRYTLAPDGTTVLYTSSATPNSFELVDDAAGVLPVYQLPADRRALAPIDASHILVEQFEPPVSDEGNPAAVDRYTLAYEIATLNAGKFGKALRLRADKGNTSRTVASNVAGTQILLHDEFLRNSSTNLPIESFWLFDLASGAGQPVTLPGYTGFGRAALGLLYP